MVLLWDNLSATPNRFDFDFMPNKAVSSIVPPSTAWYREVCENPTCWYNPYSSFKYYYFSCYLSKKFQSIMFILLLHLLIVYTGEIGILREWVVIKRCTLCACVGVIKRCSFVLIKVVDHFAYFGLGNIDWGYLHVVNLWLFVTSSVLGVKIQAWKVICLSERNSVMYLKQAFCTDFSFWGTEPSLWWETVFFSHLLHGFYFST